MIGYVTTSLTVKSSVSSVRRKCFHFEKEIVSTFLQSEFSIGQKCISNRELFIHIDHNHKN